MIKGCFGTLGIRYEDRPCTFDVRKNISMPCLSHNRACYKERERDRAKDGERKRARDRERERERKSNLGSLPTAACTTLAYSAKQHGELSHRVSGTESKTRLHQQTGVQALKPEYHEGLRTTQDPLGALCPGLIMH